ncbi:MAG: hypothetical protein K2N43_08885 [Lachnospiraceae bacterium]|nr:hypothetical protein [Lachnospiraceae bacterium]
MNGKLLKRIAVCVMTAALCTGVFVPMTAKAAEKADVLGTWKNGPGGTTTFDENGNATDAYNTRQYHMESGTITVTGIDDSEEETIRYDLWRGEKISGLEDGDDACVFRLNGDGTMTGWNIFCKDDTVYTYDACLMTKAGRSDSGKSRKSNAEKEAEEKAAAERKALEEAHREAVRLEKEAAEQGFENGAQMQIAKAADKSSGEYYNNAVVTTEGIENAVPVAQGGKLIIDGQTTNASATISKVSSVYVDSVRAAREGTVLNVVDVQFPALGAIVNFYMPGVKEGAGITAAQYIDGTWIDVEVTEVRTDHVVLNLKNNGVVAFLLK